ncbi:hypothetical protein [Mesobacillus maritimus]|uniref:hypothetical protein n=1 Tax=Mesobacillus maritimus TaxID=1643336 RepID=UPI00384FA250
MMLIQEFKKFMREFLEVDNEEGSYDEEVDINLYNLRYRFQIWKEKELRNLSGVVGIWAILAAIITHVMFGFDGFILAWYSFSAICFLYYFTTPKTR